MFDDQMKNSMEYLIAEYTGEIFKNYSNEYQRLSAYAFYPPMNAIDLRRLAIENVTSDEIKTEICRKVYQHLELIYTQRINNWNSVFQTTAKRFLTNAVDDVIVSIRKKFIDNPQTNVIVQRFELSNNCLKLV